MFFTTLSSRLHDTLVSSGLSGAAADKFSHTVTDSAGAAIGPLAGNPQTASVADAARVAMSDGVAIGGYVAAGFVVLGLLASLLIPAMPPQAQTETEDAETEDAPALRG